FVTFRVERWRVRNKRGGREAGLCEINDRTGAFAGSVFARHRTTPAEAIIQAGLDGLLVVAESGADHSRRPGGERGVAEIVILVFSLRGPVRSEHVFKTRTDRVAIAPVAGGGERLRHAGKADGEIVVVLPGITALGV